MENLASTSWDMCSRLQFSSSTAPAICYSCRGVGIKQVKGGKNKTCNPCKGTGFITRSRQRKSHRSKVSYPSFKTIGPLPVASIEEAEKKDPELVYKNALQRIAESNLYNSRKKYDILSKYNKVAREARADIARLKLDGLWVAT